ncbi:hypothetical protein COT65_02130 [Candidatus Shapirobacteria bacterium CG09_land_8_20_14_0_10_47_13]|uniref:Membrane protein 6-pyruvoyl-tetrahydropterin synthase-related domain-containing protein n=1 Tax=Candidatus Shapirobacteria bacterium CG09_land_8_20_14_0_10_47_13 TaxID=1974481 RepID=A0A2H0WMD6_9BACT|nr:MAG: hypothetical protein COT65_02130 [Candidatus Shapirobacteria bacterium CG09_land_8_20_14_0_10_47_13]
MKFKITIFSILLAINAIFFWPVWLKGQVPFPGDLLLAQYKPWSNYAYFGYAPGAVPTKFQSFDTLRQLYPWRFLAIEQFKAGQWPLWNPYNFSGTPLLANFQSAVFYPLNLLYFLPTVSFNWVWSLQVMLQPFLASLFFFLFARRLKISPPGALLGTIAFAYGSFMTVWLEYNTIGQVLLWLPVALLSIELMAEKNSFWRASLLGISLTLSFLAGHPQDFGFLWTFSLVYFLAKGRNRQWGILAFVLPFLLGAVQLLPGLELIFNSARAPLKPDYLMSDVLLKPWQLIFALVPDYFGNPATANYFLGDTYIGKVLYVGLLPLILGLLAIFLRKNYWVKFLGTSGLITLVLSIASPVSRFFWSLPVVSAFSPTRILFIFQFSVAVLAGFGLDWLLAGRKLKKVLSLLAGVGLIFLIAWFFALTKFDLVTRKNLLYSTGLFVASAGILAISVKLVADRGRKILLATLFIFVIGDLFRFFGKITPFSPTPFIFPQAEVLTFLQGKGLPAGRQGIDRFWGYGTAAIPANYNSLFHLYSPDGYDPLYPRWYGEFIRSSEDGQIKPAVRSDANVAPGFGKTDFSDNKFRQEVLRALNVRWILDREENQVGPETFPAATFPLVWQAQGWRIYENKLAKPRVYFADGGGKAVIEDYQANQVKIRAETPTTATLILADTYYPGWQAFADGQKIEIQRANHTLRSVLVPAGTHLVEFKYRPLSFKWGGLISLLSLAGWITLAFFHIIVSRQKHER